MCCSSSFLSGAVMVMAVLSVSVQGASSCRTFRTLRPTIPAFGSPGDAVVPDVSVQPRPGNELPWVRPLAIGSLIVVSLGALVLSVCPPTSAAANIKNLTAWTFGLPLGALLAAIAAACVIKLLAKIYDQAAQSLRECRFELAFLAVLGIALVFAYTYIMATKNAAAAATAASSTNNGSPTTLSEWVQDLFSDGLKSPLAPLINAAHDVLTIVIVADYLYICVEWLRKNHLTIFGFALLIVSFYLLYALP